LSFRLVDDAALDPARRSLGIALPPLEVNDWKGLDPLAAGMFELADASLLIWLSIVLIALGFGLVNALATAVLERAREFGLLRALGMRPRHVVVQVLIESLLVTLAGVVLGTAGGWLSVVLLADGSDLGAWARGAEFFGMRQILVPRLLMTDLWLVLVAAFIFAFVGSVYPAWRAVAMAPLVALQGIRT
ncbi:MAG: ABC transporter permease, partial [Pseudomonadales bacterium]